MGIEHFQKLNVRGDHRDQISLVSSFQLRRTELPQRREHLVAYDRQKLEGDKVIAVLFSIVEDSSHHRHHDQGEKEVPKLRAEKKARIFRIQRNPERLLQRLQKDVHQSVSCQDREKDRAQIADRPKYDGEQHHRQKGLYQTDKLSHDPYAASSFLCIHTAASFPYCSSSICERYSFAYSPFFFISCSCVPFSATRPSFNI